MPEAADNKVRFIEFIRKGRGIRAIDRRTTLTRKGSVEFLQYVWNHPTANFGVDVPWVGKTYTKSEQRDIFGGDTAKEIMEESGPKPKTNGKKRKKRK